jgi:hypothetical protein
MMAAAPPTGPRHPRSSVRAAPALTLLECLVAALVLSIAVVGVLMPMIAGHRSTRDAELHARAVRLAENLLEELVSRPYGTGGAQRAAWGLDQFNGFTEVPGEVRDYSGSLCDAEDQVFSRTILVTATSQPMDAIGGPALPGKSVIVRVQNAEGETWSLQRFIPAPSSP